VPDRDDVTPPAGYRTLYGLVRVLKQAIWDGRTPRWALPPDHSLYVEPDSIDDIRQEVVVPVLPSSEDWVGRASEELGTDDDFGRVMIDVWFDLRTYSPDDPLPVRVGRENIVAAEWADPDRLVMVDRFHLRYGRKRAFHVTAELDAERREIHFFIPAQLAAHPNA
jgi:hypothetical protein